MGAVHVTGSCGFLGRACRPGWVSVLRIVKVFLEKGADLCPHLVHQIYTSARDGLNRLGVASRQFHIGVGRWHEVLLISSPKRGASATFSADLPAVLILCILLRTSKGFLCVVEVLQGVQRLLLFMSSVLPFG